MLRFRRDATLWPSAMGMGRLPETDIRELTMDGHGVRIGSKLANLHGVFTGVPRIFEDVNAYAWHVDGILVFLQDVLMPRKLEAHLDDGFQAVREVLRRRIEAVARD